MSDLRTAALRALEAMKSVQDHRPNDETNNAISALRAALAETQEPVAVHQFRKRGSIDWFDGHPDHTDGGGPYVSRTLYLDPPQRPAAPIIQPEIKDDKPFGYFRAEPFGWTDCAPTDEGAIPLYERLQQPPTPPEAKTAAEKIAYCAGWWAAMETKREQNDKPQGKLLPWKGLTEEEHTYYKACGFVGVKAVEEKLRARNSTLACNQGEEGK